MATKVQYYSLSDFENLLFGGINYQLSPETMKVISFLEKELNIPDSFDTRAKYSESRNIENKHDRKVGAVPFNKNRNDGRHSKHNVKEVNNDDWTTIRNFKSTKIEVKEGIDKKFSDIRGYLNKISNKNFETQKVLIINSINDVLSEESEATEDEKLKISKLVFDIVSNNKFFSDLYTDLFKELATRFDIFKSILNDSIIVFKNSIDSINYVDPNKDYDGYCNYTKINDSRRASSAFIINMFNNGIIDIDIVFNIIEYFLNKTVEYIDSENRTNEVEEIAENIFIFVSLSGSLLKLSDRWKEGIFKTLQEISKMKSKEHASLSTRVVFKYMDIIDSNSKK
jgi:hypothetical protein